MLHGDYNDSPIGDVYYVGWVPGNKRLGIPELRLNDGPQGYRDDLNPATTTAWPGALTVANSWDLDLFRRWGEAMGDEFFRKGANVQLGPGVNLARVPKNGRNFEYISGEDPYLGYRLVQPLVQGIQSQGVIANAKHWVENNQETNRDTVSENVDERTRHELYYQPFYGAVEAGVGSFMCSYNKVNGFWACENPETLNTDLKGHLGFNGWVMSDWWATHSVSINEGLDQEMPTAFHFTPENIQAKIANGSTSVAKIDESLTRIFVPMFQFGLFDTVNDNVGTNDVTTAEHTELAREISAKSHVLLKNDNNILPLPTSGTKDQPFKIALIGKHAKAPITGGGGSGSVIAKKVVSPYDGVLAALGITDAHPTKVDCSSVPLKYNTSIAQNCWPSIPVDSVQDCAQKCAETAHCRYFSTFVKDYPWCTLFPTNYKQVSDSTTGDQVVGECIKKDTSNTWQCNADNVCVASIDGSDIEASRALAKESSVAVVFVASYASEGLDRESLSFEADASGLCQLSAPGQDSLVSVIASSGVPTVVAAAAPGAMLTPWRQSVKAILHGFMPGQEYGNAVADILFGKVNPAAKLTITLPNEENEVGFKPAEYPGLNLQGTYSEKMLIGYRWYTSYNVKPAFPFGHGLSYTHFNYEFVNASTVTASPNAIVNIQAKVTNTGSRAGAEVAQLYVTFPDVANTPPVQLKGFVKTSELKPGASQVVSFPLRARDLSVWDDVAHGWKQIKGEFMFAVGSSSADLRTYGTFMV